MGSERPRNALRSTQRENDDGQTKRSHVTLAYIKVMLGELRDVAENKDADMLHYLIGMAFLEAGDVLSGGSARMAEIPPPLGG